jgi:phosphoglycerate dehydrogenase-like enzyme
MSAERRVIHVFHPGGDGVVAAVRARAEGRTVVELADPAALAAALPSVRVLAAPLPPRSGWGSARELELVQLFGVGADMLLPSPDLAPTVEVGTLRGVFAAEVAEHVFAVLLALVRGIPTFVERQRTRAWSPFASGTLAGRTLGIVGLGAVGQRVARIAHAFDLGVVGHRRTPRGALPFVDRETSTLDELLGASDVVVVCVPHTEATHHLLDRARIARMKPGALLVDVARGGVVDELALVDALSEGHVGGAALDVFAEEPLAPASPLWAAPNVLITPHVAGLGLRYVERGVEVLLDNVRRLEAGTPRTSLVDRAAGY